MGIFNQLENIIFSRERDSVKVEQLTLMIISLIASKRDHTTRFELLKEMTLDYSRAETNLFEVNTLKNQFIGMAAHDMRNPLASIKGFSELLLNEKFGKLADSQKEFVSLIQSASNGMLGIINDILDVNLIERGRLELNLLLGSMNELVKKKIHLNNVMAEQKGITLQASLGAIPDFYFDDERIGQVLDNLLSNAIKFSNPQTIIYVSTEKKGHLVQVTVKDEGKGIPPDEISSLFGEFTKLSVRPTAGEKSTGLGLSITKKILDAHGGEIKVHSKIGYGTSFSFFLSSQRIPMNTG